MPRADPMRSDYCASRHLLRNLDDVAELRRNPLTRPYFSSTAGSPRLRDAAADRRALGRIRDDVRASLARCGDFALDRSHVALGRMHAVLLRCEIDDRPAPQVAAEIALSERQLRRERRTAHEAFARAFREALDGERGPRAAVCDVATIRLAEAVELHELGQGALAQAALASVAANAPAPERRIEALCLAAEAAFDALRHDVAAAHLDAARILMVRHARDLDEDAARAADAHVDFIGWMLRWQNGFSTGLATQPPLAAVPGEGRTQSQRHLALVVRAGAAYAAQRYEVGDYDQGRAAVRRAADVAQRLQGPRTKEHLALKIAAARLVALREARGPDAELFREIEDLAAGHGHVHTLFAARSERLVSEASQAPGGVARVVDDVLGQFDSVQRRTMARTYAWAAQLASQTDSRPREAIASARVAASLVPTGSMVSIGTRCVLANMAIDARSYEEARRLAEAVYSDAQHVGNDRLRGAAARSLAAIELAHRRRGEAQRHLREALVLTGRWGSFDALNRVHTLARRFHVV